MRLDDVLHAVADAFDTPRAEIVRRRQGSENTPILAYFFLAKELGLPRFAAARFVGRAPQSNCQGIERMQIRMEESRNVRHRVNAARAQLLSDHDGWFTRLRRRSA